MTRIRGKANYLPRGQIPTYIVPLIENFDAPNSHSSPVAAGPVRHCVNTRIPGRKTMTWDTKADQQLLLAILAAHEAVASRLEEHCTPRAVVEWLKKLKKQAIAQDECALSTLMTKASPVKKRKRVMPGENTSTNITSAADGVVKTTQAPISAVSNVTAGKGYGDVHPTEEPSTETVTRGDSVAKTGKPSSRGLLPVKYKQAVGTSYAQPAICAGQILLEERSQDRLHKVQMFSSQKVPQPFLDR